MRNNYDIFLRFCILINCFSIFISPFFPIRFFVSFELPLYILRLFCTTVLLLIKEYWSLSSSFEWSLNFPRFEGIFFDFTLCILLPLYLFNLEIYKYVDFGIFAIILNLSSNTDLFVFDLKLKLSKMLSLTSSCWSFFTFFALFIFLSILF